MRLPVVVDLRQVLRRLARDEDAQHRDLARLEDRVRSFEDVERPDYEHWVRRELGPLVTRLDTLVVELRAQATMVARVRELIVWDGLHPREALHVVQHGAPAAWSTAEVEREAVEARRRAKRDRKRAERKQARNAARTTTAAPDGATPDAGVRTRLVALYRGLARRLHPDSPLVVEALAPARRRTVWSEVQAAYAAQSLERLLALSAWLETAAAASEEADAGASNGPRLSLAERYERLRALRASGRALQRRLAELERESAWGFATTTLRDRRRLRKAAAQRLDDEIATAEATLRALTDELAAIGPPRPPRRMRGR